MEIAPGSPLKPSLPVAPMAGRGVPRDPAREVLVSDGDDFLGSVMPDLATDTAAEMERVLKGPESLSEGTTRQGGVMGSDMTDSQPVAPSRASAGGPGAERITREAEKAGFGEAEPKKGPGRPVSGLAYQGKNASVPPRPARAKERSSRIARWMDGYNPFQRDFHDLMELNAEIGMVSRAMMEVERIYGEFAKYERELESNYDQAKSRAMVEVTGSTEKTRTAYAEILVEELRMELEEVHLEVLRAERSQRMLARHLDALTVISNNLRAGFKII